MYSSIELSGDVLGVRRHQSPAPSMKSTTVTVEKMDVLFLKWNSHINASECIDERSNSSASAFEFGGTTPE